MSSAHVTKLHCPSAGCTGRFAELATEASRAAPRRCCGDSFGDALTTVETVPALLAAPLAFTVLCWRGGGLTGAALPMVARVGATAPLTLPYETAQRDARNTAASCVLSQSDVFETQHVV